MTRIDDLELRKVSWQSTRPTERRNHTPREYTLHGSDALIARYWLTAGKGELLEIESAEGRWLCERTGGSGIEMIVHVAIPGSLDEGGKTKFAFDVDTNNVIGAMRFPNGSTFRVTDAYGPAWSLARWFAGKSANATGSHSGGSFWTRRAQRKGIFELSSGEPVIGWSGYCEAQIEERAWASPGRRDLVLIGCFAAIHNTYYKESGD